MEMKTLNDGMKETWRNRMCKVVHLNLEWFCWYTVQGRRIVKIQAYTKKTSSSPNLLLYSFAIK